MNTKVGDKFPESSLYLYNEGIMKKTTSTQLFSKKKIVVFGMPGAFTPTCSNYHIPSIIKEMNNFKNNDMDEIFCLVVNDIHVTKVWAEQTGAINTGLKFISDPDGSLVCSLKLSFCAPEIGFINRSKRFCIILQNLIIQKILIEDERSICDVTSGINILKQIEK